MNTILEAILYGFTPQTQCDIIDIPADEIEDLSDAAIPSNTNKTISNE